MVPIAGLVESHKTLKDSRAFGFGYPWSVVAHVQVAELAVTDRAGRVIASSARVAGADVPADVADMLARYAAAPETRAR